ncbi:MutS-like protein [Kappamyces sp. JEL0680]|nr:MutS-like protein [Kappamyces sp. JEL0680]
MQASPGHLRHVEDLLFGVSDLASSPMVAAVAIDAVGDQKVAVAADHQLVGVAFTDASSGRSLGVSQFLDNDSFANLESLVIQQGVKECIVQKETATNYDLKKVIAILDRCGIVCTQVKPSLFSTSNLAQDMNRLLEGSLDFVATPEAELKAAMKCVACLISYLELLSEEANLGAYAMSQYDLSAFMKLDASAVKALNLIPGPKEDKRTTNLYGLLNRCKTAQGARMLGQWIKQPLMDTSTIRTRQKIVQIFFADTQLRESIQEISLKAFPDLHRLAKKFQRAKASLQDVIRIYQVVTSLPALIETLGSFQGEHRELLQVQFASKLQSNYEALAKFKDLVETTIDLKASDRHEYIIKPDFDERLLEVRSKMDKTLAGLKQEARQVADRLNMEFEKKLKFEQNPQYGYHMRLSRNDASSIRGKSDYIELKTQKAGALFTTVAMRRLAGDLDDFSKEYSKLQAEIVKEVISITGTYFPVLEEANQTVARLDVFLSLAQAASTAPIPYVCPTVVETGDLVLKASRHPCVEMQDDVSFIENDAALSKGSGRWLTIDAFFSIITGPNMGGKSTFIRQIGVITLMAQMGSYVPCAVATIPIRDAILARVGAGDSQLKGISTFMAEMLETAAILRVATERSLIIIDELGRGTSTKDGFGLAWAIAQHIAAKVKSFTLFATHFHEITVLSEEYAGVKNYHVQALLSDPDEAQKSLTLLYKVLPGYCDQSFGIHVAELAAFPSSVIQMAKRKAAELEGFDDASKKKWKCSKTEIEKGNQLIQQFLSDFSQLDRQQLDRELPGLKTKYQSEFHQSPFVQEVLKEF